MLLRTVVPLLTALLLLPSLPGRSALASSSRTLLAVQLSVSGGVNARETLRTRDNRIGSCVAWGATGRHYSVTYYSSAWLKERAQGRSPDGFILDMYPYRRGVTLLGSSFSHLLLTLVVHHRVYADGWFDRSDSRSVIASRFTLSIRVAPDGRSGTFIARHMPAGQATTGPAIDARGSWSCSTLGS